jgi:hypothetical protein
MIVKVRKVVTWKEMTEETKRFREGEGERNRKRYSMAMGMDWP